VTSFEIPTNQSSGS